MLELETALDRMLAMVPVPQPVRVTISEAHRRILAEQIVSQVNLPIFDNSAMDGYAVHARDLTTATTDKPVMLRLAGQVAAGQTFPGEVMAGDCVRIFTGSPLPQGADAVVMQEDTRVDAPRPDAVWILDAVKAWENVRFRGEDLKVGGVLGEKGDQISVTQIALMAAAGLTHALVNRRPITGLLATGSELMEAGEPLAAGKIYESNRTMLATMAAQAGAIPKIFPIVRDTLADTRAALETAFGECDTVMTSGGVSVGELDFVKRAFEDLGGTLEFWKVAMRPGKPFVFGHCKGKLLLGLPGNPVSAFVTFLMLARPVLLKWQGASDLALPVIPLTLSEPLANLGDRRHFMRLIIDPSGKARGAETQGSHILTSLASANALVDVPPKTTLPAGSIVNAMRWEN